MLNADLLRMAALLRYSAPDEAQRKACLEAITTQTLYYQRDDLDETGEEKKLSILFRDMELGDIVERTEGYSYAELTRLGHYLTLLALSKSPDPSLVVILGRLEREEVEQCLQLTKPFPAPAGGVGGVITVQTVAAATENNAKAEEERANRAAELASKKDRSFEDNWELITLTK